MQKHWIGVVGNYSSCWLLTFSVTLCAKHYENRTMLSKVTAKNVGDVFLRHTVHTSNRLVIYFSYVAVCLLFFFSFFVFLIVRIRRRRKVHVRYLICWWVSCLSEWSICGIICLTGLFLLTPLTHLKRDWINSGTLKILFTTSEHSCREPEVGVKCCMSNFSISIL